ncbi:MAG TPA: hypothetical protein PKA64_26805, partial [Myxococcota bacterium]|nr:hypothetical protein [Myxococcota bacterium]
GKVDRGSVTNSATRESVRRSLRLLETVVDTPPIELRAVQAKGAYTFAVVLRAVLTLTGFTVGLIGALHVLTGVTLAQATADVTSHPAWDLGVLLTAWLVARVILFRLDDLDGSP